MRSAVDDQPEFSPGEGVQTLRLDASFGLSTEVGRPVGILGGLALQPPKQGGHRHGRRDQLPHQRVDIGLLPAILTALERGLVFVPLQSRQHMAHRAQQRHFPGLR